jgi:Uma2 family endonuclease
MVATVPQIENKATPIVNINGNGHSKSISWQDFKRRYLSREDKYKYEWVNGYVEKTTRAMTQNQQFIYNNLLDLFKYLLETGKTNGRLKSEVDTFFKDEVHRRPDIAYFTDEQEAFMAHDIEQRPNFIVEVISTNDQINAAHLKMDNYRAAKVKIVWHVFPLLNQVHVYYGEDLTEMKVCKGDKFCSAEPVIEGFLIKASDVFKKPALPNVK